ncbi:universal stress protein [Myxococcaceae bacterium JPH2]|nr:universal stress protein [Myxococcaceae bacterium JPH2]
MRPHETLRGSKPLLLAGPTRGQRGLSRVVVGMDFSLGSEFALARALRLPLGHGATFSVLHASPPLDGRNGPDGTLPSDRCLRRAVASACRRLRGRLDVEVCEAARQGEPAEVVAALADELGAELVVVGRPHVTYPVRELAMDALVRRLVRRVGTSVLVVVPHPARAYQRPLVAVNFSRESRRALELTLRLCPSSAVVDVLHVVDAREEESALDESGSRAERRLLLRQERESAARAALVRFLAPYREIGRTLQLRVRWGEPSEGILAESLDQGSDLLALGMSSAEARTPMTERVLARAPCDVLVSRHLRSLARPGEGGLEDLTGTPHA